MFFGKLEGEGGGVFEIWNSKCLKIFEMNCLFKIICGGVFLLCVICV